MTCTDDSNRDYLIGNAEKMGAVAVEDKVQFTVFNCAKCSLKLYVYDSNHCLLHLVNMLDYAVTSTLCSVILPISPSCSFTYIFEADGKLFTDPFSKRIKSSRQYKELMLTPDESMLYTDNFEWAGDSKPNLDYSDIIAYQLHVRGFTAHSSSRVKSKGKYMGIVEKIPYLSDLGINQIVLMPSYEYYEYDEIKINDPLAYTSPIAESKAISKNNYWGFKEGLYYLPKNNFANSDAVSEFKQMVKELHCASIEIVMRFYFPDSFNRLYITDVLRYWSREYHVDGFFLMGNNIPLNLIAADPFLSDCKIYTVYYDKNLLGDNSTICNTNCAFANNDFAYCMRRFLKSDEDMINDFIYRARLNPSDIHNINYITDYEGFTLNDLVSYDYKHNDDNGESNRDGENYNYSWNCGLEGNTRKKAVLNLRTRQIKNALVLLLLSQATPMLLAGDECLNTQMGNNNAYCQDNETGWVVWKETVLSKEIHDFTQMLIKLRKSHPILHMNQELRIMDSASCGYPDLSYHSEEAWSVKLENHYRHIGLMLCGKYAINEEGNEDDFFYIAYNMHWEKHSFGLPNLPKGLKWKELFTTDNDKVTGSKVKDINVISERSISVFTSSPDDET